MVTVRSKRSRSPRCSGGISVALVVAVSIAGLSGCASIPTSGVPNHVSDVDTDTSVGYNFNPAGPKDGASAEDILRGFIDAGTGFANDYAVAREYLTSSFADEWDPSASVLVYDGQPTVTTTDGGAATVTLSVGASIDEDGHLTESSTNSDVTQDFTVVREGGQWRISAAPDGVSIIRPRFSLIYTQQTLYFYDPDFSYRVPDVRWIANTPWAATRLVQLLLKGPSSWLTRGVVATAFPDGTTLAVDTIPVSSSVATVDLSAQALSADTRDRQLMLLQLQSTLSGLSSVSKVQLSVGGTVVPIDDLGSNAPVSNPSPQSQRLIVDVDGVLRFLNDDGTTEQVGGLADAIGAQARGAFVIRGDTAVATSQEGVWLTSEAGEQARQVADGVASNPSIDPHAYAWAVVGGALRVFAADGTEVSVSKAWLGGEVLAARLSRDGTRLALLVRDGSNVQVLISGLIRDKDGKPSELAKPLTLDTLDASALAIAWFSDQDVAVLSTAASTSTVTVMTVGGETTTKTSTSAAVGIAAGSGEDSIRLLMPNGDVYAPRGSSWLQVATGVTAIGYAW